MNDPVKVCERCLIPYPLDQFYHAPGNADGRASRCQRCCVLDGRYDLAGRRNDVTATARRNSAEPRVKTSLNTPLKRRVRTVLYAPEA